MADTNKKIIFSAADQNVASTMDRLKRSAKEMSADLVREAQASASNQKDIKNHYEEQIKLIQQRNKLAADSSRFQAAERRDSIMNNPNATASQISQAKSQYASSISQINRDQKADSLLIKYVKDILDSMRLDSRKESEEDVRDKDEDFSRRPSEGGGGRAGEDSGRSDRRGGGRGPMDVAGYLMGVQQMLGATSGAGMLSGAGGAMMGMGMERTGKIASYVGMVGEIANAMRDARADLHKQMFKASAITGVGATDMDALNWGDNAYNFGFTRDEALSSIIPQQAQARGGFENVRAGATRNMQLARGSGVDIGTIMQLERMGARGMQAGMKGMFEGSGNNALEIMGRVLASHSGTSAFTTQGGRMDLSKLDDTLQNFMSMQQEMMMRSGAPGTMGGALALSAQFEGMGGAFKDDQYKWSTIQSIDRGLASQGSPEAQGIKMAALRKAMPNASYSELMAEMERGLDSDALTLGVLDFVKNTAGDENSQAIMLRGILGNQLRWADANAMVSKGTDNFANAIRNKDKNEQGRKVMEQKLMDRAGGVVSEDVRGQIEESQRLQDVKGDPNADTFGRIVDMYGERLMKFFDRFDVVADALDGWLGD